MIKDMKIALVAVILSSIFVLTILSTSSCDSTKRHIDDANFASSTVVEEPEQMAGYTLLKKHIIPVSAAFDFYFELEKTDYPDAPFKIVEVKEELYLRYREGHVFKIPYLIEDTGALDGYTVMGKRIGKSYDKLTMQLTGEHFYLTIQKEKDLREVEVKQVIFERVNIGDTFPLPAEKEENPEKKYIE